MSWIPVVATVVGAVVGLGSGLLIDHVRSRRDNTAKWLTVRRETYASYLSALHEANEAMRAVSLGEHAQDLTRMAAARAAFRAARVTMTREQVILLAPEPVIIAADAAFRSRALYVTGSAMVNVSPTTNPCWKTMPTISTRYGTPSATTSACKAALRTSRFEDQPPGIRPVLAPTHSRTTRGPAEPQYRPNP